ncbi:aromatic/alkene monooxygenase hydroxylase subunit beta [Alkalilimnicola sp. S0819]|uniref:aromatic/alkene monooxygenase hydroxylase subunit beta n=1 Tax=Alkalilimnicola sp. S0819 TaxID=2613922 RepID=UPI00126270D2|nr:aromatic/alkene monooxygenase hydroxylase subunit beta [Alkalilimnicola sp. S0819]KAB7627382.1 phenol hydroxylase [Alkalilimnicola sp. S0819]MPQ16101.1 phenol hydroxylase [Alkalilimnicola sp. S0819]
MSIDIKTSSIEPLRHTFANVARRLGADKPASRYLEAMYDLQPTVNFHYRPLWDSEHELYDTGRTRIAMEDWYALKDPRQYYYGTWVMTRSRQQEVAERNFAFVEKRKLLGTMSEASRDKAAKLLVPLRHLEYAANLNNTYICAYGYGTATTQAAMFTGMDRLAIAQYLSRIGLMIDGNSAETLDAGKQAWTDEPLWQPLRQLAEELMVQKDWFELLVAQDYVLDGLLYPLVYDRIDAVFERESGAGLSMLTEFMSEWYTEHCRWTDAVLKVAAKESDANKQQIEQWINAWMPRVAAALAPVAEYGLGGEAQSVMSELQDELKARAAKKSGLDL